MKHIFNFYKKHKLAAFFTILWLIFMIYIATDGIQVNGYTGSNAVIGVVAGVIMFVPGAVIIAITCAALSKILNALVNVSDAINTFFKDRKIEDPVIPAPYNTSPTVTVSEVMETEPNEPEKLEETEPEEPEEPPKPLVPEYDIMEGHVFEYYCAELLKNDGFSNVEVTQGSGDQGIDILAEKAGIQYGIQCKCYSNNIGNKAVQEAFSGKTFYGCHVAAVLTNRYFTTSAKALAEQNKVLLWDRDYLQALVDRADNNAPA